MPEPSRALCQVLLLTGPDRHAAYDQAVSRLTKQLEASGRFAVSVVSITGNGAPALANLPDSDFNVVLAMTGKADALPESHAQGLAKFVEAGGGLIVMHRAAELFMQSESLRKLLDVTVGQSSPTAFNFKVRFTPAAKEAGHTVAVRCDDFHIHDTLLAIKPGEDADVFAVAHIDGRDTPVGLTQKAGKGRVAYLANGGAPKALGNPNLVRMVERSIRHVCGETFDKTIGVGIIGYGGAFGMGKVHGEALNAQRGCKTVAVCDSDPARAKHAKTELGDHIRTYTKYQDLLEDDKVDLVIVILPHNLHAEVCIAASEAGKHVVTEKPFCITLAEADAMIAAAEKAGTMLSCFHNRRWDGDFRQMLSLVKAGEIGDIFHADAASGGWGEPNNWWRASKPVSGGVLYDWGAHYADWLLNFIPKRIESVSGVLHKHVWHNTSNEDYALVNIRFEGGVSATIEQGTLVSIHRAGWRILGTTGGLTNAGPGAPVTLTQHREGIKRESKLDPWQPNWHSYYQNVANHLIMDEPLIVTARQARRTIAIFELAEKSHAQGGKPLPLPGEEDYTPDYAWPI
jgi:predicted dehydrogenase/type 1 glutamine amidotransferase